MIKHTTYTDYFTNGSQYGNFQNVVTKGYNAGIYGDIYLSGFAYIIWTKIPTFMAEGTELIGDFKAMSRTLYKAVQIPDATLNTTEVVTGFAGTNRLSIPTTIDIDTSLTITYNELSGTPMTKFHQRWISAIRDYASGVSDIANYGINNYTGELLYITTKPVHYKSQGSFGSETNSVPNEQMIETAHLFTHVFPINDKQSNFSMNIESSDKIELDITYKFSHMFMGDAVNKFATTQLDNIIKLKDMDNYKINVDGTVDSTF